MRDEHYGERGGDATEPLNTAPDFTLEQTAPLPELHEEDIRRAEARTASSGAPTGPSPAPAGPDPGGKKPDPMALRAVWITVASVLLIVMVSATAYLFSMYDISLNATDAGLEMSFDLKEDEAGADIQIPIPQLQDPDPDEEVAPMPSATVGDGTTLDIEPVPVDEASGERQALSYPDIYKKCSPSIVSVEVTIRGGYATGTGIIMSENGYIITNAHVVEDARSVEIVLESGDRYNAAIVGEDDSTDLAVLKIDADGLPPAEFGDSGELEVGEAVVVIGNPLGQILSMSDGIVSALDRDVTYNGTTMSLIQTNAAINEGNSGGPLINVYGQVVGITNMKLMSYYSTVEGMGFAIPTSSVKPVVDELIDRGYVAGRPGIGIMTYTVYEEEAEYAEMEPGIYIESVVEGSDAEKKGLLPGDVIIACNGIEVTTADELNDIKNEYGVGDTIVLTVTRDGEELDFEVELMDSALLQY